MNDERVLNSNCRSSAYLCGVDSHGRHLARYRGRWWRWRRRRIKSCNDYRFNGMLTRGQVCAMLRTSFTRFRVAHRKLWTLAKIFNNIYQANIVSNRKCKLISRIELISHLCHWPWFFLIRNVKLILHIIWMLNEVL